MKAFCPNCGSPNEGMPGGRVTCHTCTASFEVPRERATQPPAEPTPAIEKTFVRPTQPPVAAPPSVVKPPPPLAGPAQTGSTPLPTGYRGPPPTGFGAAQGATGELNQLATISLVLGIVCCIPLSGIGAIVTGVMARNQIAASQGAQRGNELALAGIVLGTLSVVMSLFSLLANVLGLLR